MIRHDGGFDLDAVRRAIELGPVPAEIAGIWADNARYCHKLSAEVRENVGFPGSTVTKRTWDSLLQFENGAELRFCGNWSAPRTWVQELFERPRDSSAWRRLYLNDWPDSDALVGIDWAKTSDSYEARFPVQAMQRDKREFTGSW